MTTCGGETPDELESHRAARSKGEDSPAARNDQGEWSRGRASRGTRGGEPEGSPGEVTGMNRCPLLSAVESHKTGLKFAWCGVYGTTRNCAVSKRRALALVDETFDLERT